MHAIRDLENTYAHQYALYRAAEMHFTNESDLKPYEIAYEKDCTQFDHDLHDEEIKYLKNQKQLNQVLKSVIDQFVKDTNLNRKQEYDKNAIAIKSKIDQLADELDSRLHWLEKNRDAYRDIDKIEKVENRLDRDMNDQTHTSSLQPHEVEASQEVPFEQRQQQVIELMLRHTAILEGAGRARELINSFFRDVPAVFESGNVLLLNERNATLRVITKTLKVPDLQKDLVKFLEIPPDTLNGSLAQAALAFAYTSKYIEYLRKSSEDNAGIMKQALEAVQKEKTQILKNPSQVIFLPIKYLRRANIDAGTAQVEKPIEPDMRVSLEKDLAQQQFTQGEEEKWKRWQGQSHRNLRYDLAPLGLSFQGKKVLSLEQMRLDKPEDGNKLMWKLTRHEGKAYFLNVSEVISDLGLWNGFFRKAVFSLSGKQAEYDDAAHHEAPARDHYWERKDIDWHIDTKSRLEYQSILHPMMEDYFKSAFSDLIRQGRKKISIVDLGGGSGNLAELLLKNIGSQHPDISVTYGLLDSSSPDIETAKERFKLLGPSSPWEVRMLVKDVFSDEFNAEEALRDMGIPGKADIILSSGGPLSPFIGKNLQQTLDLSRMLCTDMLAPGGYCLATGGSGVWPNRSHHEQNGMEVKNTFDVINSRRMYVIQKPYGHASEEGDVLVDSVDLVQA